MEPSRSAGSSRPLRNRSGRVRDSTRTTSAPRKARPRWCRTGGNPGQVEDPEPGQRPHLRVAGPAVNRRLKPLPELPSVDDFGGLDSVEQSAWGAPPDGWGPMRPRLAMAGSRSLARPKVGSPGGARLVDRGAHHRPLHRGRPTVPALRSTPGRARSGPLLVAKRAASSARSIRSMTRRRRRPSGPPRSVAGRCNRQDTAIRRRSRSRGSCGRSRRGSWRARLTVVRLSPISTSWLDTSTRSPCPDTERPTSAADAPVAAVRPAS